MTAVYTLPQELRDELSWPVSSVFQRSIALFNTDETEQRLDTWNLVAAVAESILNCVRDALAVELRAHNASTAAQRLPDEVWCAIWEYLPFFDCVAVTHVCARWRKVALACPTVWQRITCYITLHAADCWCRDCAGDDKGLCCKCYDIRIRGLPDTHRIPTGWMNSPYRPRTTNFEAAGLILQRSAGLPLSITLDITPYYAHCHPLDYLAGVIRPYVHRLQKLHIRSADTDAVCYFLSRFPELPSLRDLEVDYLENRDSFCLPRDAFPRHIALPALESVKLGDGFHWPNGSHFPLIRSLSLAPRLQREVARALHACPGIECFRLDLTNFNRERESDQANNRWESIYDDDPDDSADDTSDSDAEDEDPFEYLPARLVWVKTVAHSHNTRWVLAALQTCAVDYFTAAVPPSYLFWASGWGDELVNDLAGQISISCELRDEMLIVHGLDSHGRHRQLHWERSPDDVRLGYNKLEDIIRSFLGVVPRDSVVDLSVCVSIWSALSAAFPCGSSVKCLTLIVDEIVGGEGEAGERSVSMRQLQACFPALKTLRISGGGRAVEITGADIAKLLRKLGLRVPVDNLIVDHRIFVGEPGLLYDLAAAVDLGYVATVQEEYSAIENRLGHVPTD